MSEIITTGQIRRLTAASAVLGTGVVPIVDASGNLLKATIAQISGAVGFSGRSGSATLVAGTVTVANTSVTANTKIIYSRAVTGGTEGHLSSTKSAGVSFTITSSSNADTSVIDYLLVESA